MCEAVSSAPFIPRTNKDIHSIEQEGTARLSLKIFHFQDSWEKKGNVFIFPPHKPAFISCSLMEILFSMTWVLNMFILLIVICGPQPLAETRGVWCNEILGKVTTAWMLFSSSFPWMLSTCFMGDHPDVRRERNYFLLPLTKMEKARTKKLNVV